MDVSQDTSFVLHATDPDVKANLKRKQAVKAIRPIYLTKGYVVTDEGDCKRPKVEADKPKNQGSVTYQSFSPEIYGWPSKFPVQDACNFQRSGLPSRVMFYDKGSWKDFVKEAIAILCDSFRARKSSIELALDGKRYLVNFERMFQLNLLTGYLRSVAWIDEKGKCFFPSKSIEGPGTRLLSQLQDSCDHQRRLTGTDCGSQGCERVLDSCHDNSTRVVSDLPKSAVTTTSKEASSIEATSDVSSDLSVNDEGLDHAVASAVRVSHDFALLGDKLDKLDEGDEEFVRVRDRFMTGLGVLAPYTTITGIQRDCHRSPSGQARLQAFTKQEEVTRKARGDANIRYSWHGTSKQGVSSIVLHGFGQPRIPKNGAMYGVGVYLAPEDYSHVSAVYSDVDENGEQHMVLCQAIMGSMEQVSAGSEQFHPSSEDYDTGVDDICNPKRYIIWSTCMNTHILPLYIVSFKLAPQWHVIIAALRGKQNCGKNVLVARVPRLDGEPMDEQSTSVKVGDAVSGPSCKAEVKISTGSGSSRGFFRRVPRSPWMSFPMLFLVMKSKLPPSSMAALQQHYLEFKAGKVPRDVLIKNVRIIAGDHILADSIKSMQVQEKVNSRMDTCPNPGAGQTTECSIIPVTREMNTGDEAL